MLENSFYTNNNVDKQVFNASGTGAYVVGQPALGGTVAYILQPGDPGYDSSLQQGYIIAPASQGSNIAWWNGTAISISTSSALGTGLANTDAIIAAQGAGTYAASICRNYTGGGYNDWYLPSRDELSRIYGNNSFIGIPAVGSYWTSTQTNSTGANSINFSTGAISSTTTSGSVIARAIRSFSVPVSAPTPWQTWSKPEGRSMAYIVCIGGGGGGAAGQTHPTLSTSGSGGGASSITIAQVPFYSIPDTLYIQVALGGIGGTPTAGTGNPGSSGGISYVSCYPTIDMYNCLLINGGIAGGGVNSAVGGGFGGAALSSSSTTNPRYLSLCNWVSYSGQAGQNGSSGSPAGNTMASNSICSAGAAGGGAQGIQRFPGAPLNSGDTLTSFFKTIAGGVAPSGRGNDGYSYLKPFFFLSGTGGGGSVSGAAGAGGNGNIGCGGAGGGAGTGASGTGGNGGNGGNGLVMIISY